MIFGRRFPLITVNIKFLLYLESSPELSIGKKVVPVELEDGATFGGFLSEIESNFGADVADVIYDPRAQSLQEMVRAIVNGVLVHNLHGVDTVLQQGDDIIFVPFVMGG